MAQRCYYCSTNDAVGSVKSKQVKSRKATGGGGSMFTDTKAKPRGTFFLYMKNHLF